MQPARLCRDEHERLEAVRALGLPETQPEPRFDRFVRIARQIVDAPIASLTLVDHDRQWFKSIDGVSLSQTEREAGFFLARPPRAR